MENNHEEDSITTNGSDELFDNMDLDTEEEHDRNSIFDSFDMDDLYSQQSNAHNFTIFLSPSTTPLPKELLKSITPAKTFDGLLSKPEFDLYLPNSRTGEIPKYSRPLKISETLETHTLADFMSRGPPKRSSRRVKMKCRKSLPRSSKQLRTFHSRLEGFRPFFDHRISNSDWNQIQCFKDILSITSESLQEDGDEGAIFSIDRAQALSFREYRAIVLIGYIIKMASPCMSRLEELCENIGVVKIPLKANITPSLFLEDHTTRIRLDLSFCERLNISEIVSGVPVALKGAIAQGIFWVDDVMFCTPFSPELPLSQVSNSVDMVFVSGLNMSKPFLNMSSLTLLFDYLQGICGSEAEQGNNICRTTRVFFLGNLFHKRYLWDRERSEELITLNCDIADKLDYYFDELAKTMEIFIIPGENDPTHKSTLPQPPIHKQLFPNSIQHNTFHSLTNPAKIHLDMQAENEKAKENLISLVLSSGRNVKATMEHCDVECPLEMCIKLMEWSHLHPTSTEDGNLAEEIFTLTALPNLFVVGGLSDFKIKDWNGVKIVGVPSFSSTGIVMVLSKSGDIFPMQFKV